MKAERESNTLRTIIRVGPPHGKTRSAKPPPDVHLQLKVQDVTEWLTDSYHRAALPLPPALAHAVSEDFTKADLLGNASGENLVPSLSQAVHESLRAQFSSLVVDGDSVAEEALHTGPSADGDKDSRLELSVLEAIVREPGASQSALRALLRGTRSIDVDHAVRQLIERGLVENRRKGNANAYHLTRAGQARVQPTNSTEPATEEKTKGEI